MAPKGKKKVKVARPAVTYDLGEEQTYRNEQEPNPSDNPFFNDDVDDFHNQKDKTLLDKGVRSIEPADFSSDEKESVLGVGDDDSSDDEEVAEYKQRLKQLRLHGVKEGFDSDPEDKDAKKQEDGLPNEKAWGKKRRGYYWADDVSDNDDFEEDDSTPGAAELEEKEALKLQQKLAEQLDDTDFGLGIFEAVKKPVLADRSEKITTDVSHLSHAAKLELLRKESPEILELIADYKAKMTELHTRWLPLHEMAESGQLPASQGTRYISTKVELTLNYCINVSFYLTLKAKHTPQLHSHPIVKRLVQYMKMMKQMEPADGQIAGEVDKLLATLKAGVEVKFETSGTQASVTHKLLNKAKKRKRRKEIEATKKLAVSHSKTEGGKAHVADKGGPSSGQKRKVDDTLTRDEREALDFYDVVKAGKKLRGSVGQQETVGEQDDATWEEPSGERVIEEELGDGKREVTYQILKNKGLQPPKKKEHRNPRVKNRMKARKQKIRRKGQIREVRTEMTRYSGEISGIRAGIKRSTKFR